MQDFVHLHNHSDYSLLDGASSIPSLVARAQDLGMKHLALTDHGNMFGALKFYKTCKNAGINPIIGCEFYVATGSRHDRGAPETSRTNGADSGSRYNHLILLARDQVGYRNLLQLTSYGYTEGFYYKPRIDHELLERYSSGLICTSACLAGLIPQKIVRGDDSEALQIAGHYAELFGKEGFYLELQDHGIEDQKRVNRALLEISRKTGIPLIATNDIHYTNADDAGAQDVLLCIGTNKKRNETERLRFGGPEFYMKSQEQMWELFGSVPEALTNTLAIAEQCSLEIDLPGPLLPDYSYPVEFTSPDDYLRHLTFRGLAERYPNYSDEIRDRAEYELETIISMGFTGYFLIVWDFIDWAHRHEIPVGPGRGSGAGSIVAYSLRITDIDPLKYGLLFERFLNPERVSMPDFDIDFCFERRGEVIDYVTQKYGSDRVGQIITFGTLKPKAVIRDVARALDLPYAEADSIAKLVPPGPKMTLEQALQMEPKLAELADRGKLYEELLDTSRRLEGLSRHASTHAAGIVIGKQPLTSYVPLYRDPKTGSISTQYTMDQLEECGLVKMDFLGLKTLTLIENTVGLINRRGIDFDVETIPEDDAATFKMLGEGKSTCVFQFESTGMQGILRRAKPSSIEDLIALNALYRPGPMANIDQFINAKTGRTPIAYPLPELGALLEETYGVIVYQEQVMEIARMIAGYSLGEADILRRAMGKKKHEVMNKEKVKFVGGATKRGYTKKQAEDMFEMLIPFAGYGFNKSHAAAYSVLAYKTAYLKANYGPEFMAANLTNEINNTDKLSQYITETREMGIEILPPDVNLSEKYFSVTDGHVVYGLIGIKNVGSSAVEEILRARAELGEFSSFVDFLEKVDLKVVNRKVIESLIQSGLFDRMGVGRRTLMHNLEGALEIVSKRKEGKMFGQTSLFEDSAEPAFSEIRLEEVEEYPELERLRFEKEHLGFYVSGHPLDKFEALLRRRATLKLDRADRAIAEKTYTAIGLVTAVRTIITKKGRPMAFGTLEDTGGSIEMVIFSDPWEKYGSMLNEDAIVAVEGKVDPTRGEPKLLVDRVLAPEELQEASLSELHIRLSDNLQNEDELYGLRSLLCDHSGSSSVYLHLPGAASKPEVIVKVSSQIQVAPAQSVIEEIRRLPRVEEVWQE